MGNPVLNLAVASTSLDSWPTSDKSHCKNTLGKDYVFATESEAHDRWRDAFEVTL